MSQSFKAYLIGADTLLTECGQILLDKGHSIGGVITSADRIAAWARQQDLRVIDAKAPDLALQLTADPFDYLFAITHLAIIPDDVAACARKMAINFHDGPLPRYAGLHTPVWALLAQEPQYGITWHQITSGVDEGGVLKQALFDLAPRETSLSLNTRNFASAMETFAELVDELARGEAAPRPQSGERTYFGRHQRPTARAVLDLELPAHEVEATVRALDFGAYPNPVAAAVLVAHDRAVLVGGAEARDLPDEEGSPGQVLDLDDEALVVGTQEGAVAFSGFRTLTGEPLTPSAAADRLGVEVGATLPSSAGLRDALLGRAEALSKAEAFWTRRLRGLEPLELPWAKRPAEGASRAVGELDVEVPAGFLTVHQSSGASAPLDAAPLDAAPLDAAPLDAAPLDAAPLDHALAAAAAVYLGRVGAKSVFDVGHHLEGRGPSPLLAEEVPLHVEIDDSAPFERALEGWRAELARLASRETFLLDVIARTPELSERFAVSEALLPVSIDVGAPVPTQNQGAALRPGCALAVRVHEGSVRLAFDESRLARADAERIGLQLTSLLAGIAQVPDTPVGKLNLLTAEEREQILHGWNATQVKVDPSTIHELFCRRVDAQPGRVAVRAGGTALTYRELDERANALAKKLIEAGAGPDKRVGVHVDRSVEMMVAVLGVLKAGAAYVPLDPTYPDDRIHYMIEDAKLTALVTRGALKARLPADVGAPLLDVDELGAPLGGSAKERPPTTAKPEHLAYVIYTSGSTGRPKGVMVEHRNVVNFFVGMDAVVPHEPPGRWLAVTSLSFDISVLELLWTLTRGFEVVIYRDTAKDETTPSARRSGRRMDFGLFYWGNDDGEGREKYRLLLDGARFADTHGFTSVWTPERHFHAFGGPYPNPSVTGAAVAAVTQRLSVRSGSCVLPLHHPIRVAEEWAVVDNLSNGRAALSIASGWQPDDFILRPESYPDFKNVMFESVETLRRLWRGEKVKFNGPRGEVEVVTQPRPVQKELPIWVTTAGNPDTYRQAAAVGGNVLTHLLGQSVEEVAEKIKIYRGALEEAGKDRMSGKVTLMLHTFVGRDTDEVREIVREPMKDYLRSSISLVKSYAWAFPAFKRPAGAKSPLDVDLGSLEPDELEAILDFAFERYFEDSGLFGDVETCLDQIDRLKAIEVDEVACLIDFGVPTATVLEMLPLLADVHDRSNQVAVAEAPWDESSEDYGIAALIQRHHVSHMQCTPSMARMLSTDPDTKAALAMIDHLFVGGEAFPVDLARALKQASLGTVRNMYGPTETTIWSSTEPVAADLEALPIGRPIANNRLYVLNASLEPQPVGVPGELFIGGDGVVRGYLDRPELTAERFVNDPFMRGGARMYRTGDVARFLPDGRVDFLGRADHQVKIRGYRVELGEIEARLLEHPSVQVCAALVREDTPGDQRLVAYVVPAAGATKVDEAGLKAHLKEHLPEYMIPQHFVALDVMPQTPNKKIDKKALPPPGAADEVAAGDLVAPAGDLERKIADIWCAVLGRDQVGVDNNFFDLGGHSLLVVRLNRELKQVLEVPVSLTDLYRFPTIRTFVRSLETGGASEQVKASADRGARRREALAARRRQRGKVS